MDTGKSKMYELLDEIRGIIETNELPDGTYRFNEMRAVIALEFVKLELEKGIAAQNENTEIDEQG